MILQVTTKCDEKKSLQQIFPELIMNMSIMLFSLSFRMSMLEGGGQRDGLIEPENV